VAPALFHYFLADSQSYTVACIFFARVQALKDRENLVLIFTGNPNAIVSNCDFPLIAVPLRRNIHHGRLLSAKLNSVANEVLKQLHKLRMVGPQHRKGSAGHYYSTFLHRSREVPERLIHGFIAISAGVFLSVAADARKRQQVFNKSLQPNRAFNRIANIFICRVVQLPAITVGEKLGIGGNHPQWFLKVVRGDIGKLFEIAV